MSLLSVTVKKARYVGVQTAQFNTYVTLKLQNVKSTTVTVKGPTPCWEQDFLFEINDINLGLLVEVWNKGVIWDRAIGYHYMPLASVAYDGECGPRWVELEAQCMMRGGTVVGTTGPTGHALLLDCRFEPPFDAEGTVGADLQRKLDLLNGTLDAERAEQARRQMQYIAHSGYSEDSDYTSDLNYPVGQHPNCSASQFRSAAHQMHTPQRSLEVSRENSYERDEYHIHGDSDPLYYNSQPRSNRIDTWSQLHAQASVESAISWRTATDWQSGEDRRRPSLERQNTLYDESIGFGVDSYTPSTHIRDHAHISPQTSYEEYFDSSSYIYQTTYVGDDSRQWDSGGRFFYDDYGMTPTKYENLINKRRSSIVQLPQVPPKQKAPSSRYSDYNEMAPYRPRPRRTAASLPATPSSTPKRGRALPMPPGSETGSLRGGRRRLPKLPHQPSAPASATRHVPCLPEPDKPVTPDLRYDYDSFGYRSEFTDNTTEPYQEPNFSLSCDEDGMQPFFDETPHATPPAATQKSTWSEVETTTQFSYSTTAVDSMLPKITPLTISSYKSQPTVTVAQDIYQEQNYQQTEEGLVYDDQQNYNQFDKSLQRYQEPQIQFPEMDASYLETLDYHFTQELDIQKQEEIKMQQKQFEDHQEQQRQLQLQRQQQQQQQQKQRAQQLQASVLTGAATLGSLMAGGAKKLGSFFGAAAAAVGPSTQANSQQMSGSISMSQLSSVQLSTFPGSSYMNSTSLQNTTYVSSERLSEEAYMAINAATPFISTTTVTVTEPLPGDTAPACSVTTSTPLSLHRTPSLRRQESIQRPVVRRTRTLPEAPDDIPPSSYDDSAYEEEYNKTEFNQSIDRDRTSLDRYNEDDFVHDSIQEDVTDDAHLAEEPSSVIQKVASPTRTASTVRKSSVDSYHCQTPSGLDRKKSQSSFHHEDKLIVSVTQEEPVTEKSKVTFKDDRTTYHEVPEDNEFTQQDDQYREDQNYAEERESFRDENEKFENQEFSEGQEGHFQGEEVFQEQPGRIEQEPLQFQPEQPKLTPKQRWHRAYNKIVMQLNVSTLNLTMKVVMLFALLIYLLI